MSPDLNSTVIHVAVGATLGPYRIEALLGAGGMGQVFIARDTRLDRTIAIKIVHERFNDRFERESRAISSLNHPHICTLYDVGPNYLVMELVEGETLASRLQKGPLPMDLAIRYGVETADALAAAHAKLITHRDLKPANIMVNANGVKVLDFGLAKTSTPLDELHTATHAVMGTPAYMAPEQLEGKPCDNRADIYAFGLVLYEMLTGKRLPGGAKPDMDGIPRGVLHVIERCLEVESENRWQSARDLMLELQWAATRDPVRPEPVPRRAFLPWIAGAAVAGAGGAGLAGWAWSRGNSSAPAGATRFRLAPPEGAQLTRAFTQQSLALAPVGRRLAMIATGARGSMIWVQRLDSLTATPLQGTEGATLVFWSPDGQFIGFWAGGKLKKIPAEGGTPLPIGDLSEVGSATWNETGIIVASTVLGPSFHISVKSGAISTGRLLRWPKFLPGGKHLLYVNPDPRTGRSRAYAAELSTGRETELMPTDTQLTFTADHAGNSQGRVLFGLGATLQAIRFDTGRLRVAGEPVSVAKDVPSFDPTSWSEFDTSSDGTLIYSTGGQEAQLTWLDRGGRTVGVVGDPRDFLGSLRLSPDGRKLAADVFEIGSGGTDIWVYDLSQATSERITFKPDSATAPVWSPDGTRIAYGGTQGPPLQLRVKALSDRGSGDGFPAKGFQLPGDWSADGRWIFYQTNGGEGNAEIWLASVADHKMSPLLQTQFDSSFPALSPDQMYLAFSANDTGRAEIYVQRFQGGDAPRLAGERRRVSHNSGTGPRWRRDGKELFYLSPDQQIMAVPVRPGTETGFGPPAALFRLPTSYRPLSPVTVPYDVSADGRRFLVPIRKAAGAPLQVVVNWQAELKQ